jgi:hypothetical protein
MKVSERTYLEILDKRENAEKMKKIQKLEKRTR